MIALTALTSYNLVYIKQAQKEQRQVARQLDLIRLSNIVARDVALDGLSDFEKAIAIRHYIHSNHRLGQGWEDITPSDLSNAWIKITSGEATVLSSWVSLIYLAALESQGIPARYVGIFSRNETQYDSLASVEFYFDGQWIASDPIFNIMFVSGDYWLSWADVYNGMSYDVTTNGRGEPDRWNDYYIGLDDLLKFVVIHNEPLILLPFDWNGHISGVDVTNYNATFQFLAAGPLR